MKQSFFYCLCSLCVLFVLSCVKEASDSQVSDNCFLAAMEKDDATRLSFQDNGAHIYWSDGDEIRVFCSGKDGKYTNVSGFCQTASFQGKLGVRTEDAQEYFAIYPYSENSSFDGTDAIVTIPSIQSNKQNTAFVMMAQSNDHTLAFKNICGGIKISVTKNKVYKIIVRANNNEYLAGTVRVRFDGGVPQIIDVIDGQSSVTLTGGYFSAGTDYYIPCLPTILSGGYTVELFRYEQPLDAVAQYVDNQQRTIFRSKWSRIRNIDSSLNYQITSSQDDKILLYKTTDGKKLSENHLSTGGYFGVRLDSDITSLSPLFSVNASLIKELIIPEGITDYDRNFPNLVAVKFPNSLQSIKEGAFKFHSSLQSVSISSVQSWCNVNFVNENDNPLYYAHNLYLNGDLVTNLTIPQGVTAIGNYTFSGCTEIVSISIPESLISIGKNSFNGCTSLTRVNIKSVSAWCNILYANETDNPLYYAHNLSLNGELITNLAIPDGVTSIEKYAFSGCTGLTSIDIPNSLTTIGKKAFNGCTSLNGVYVSDLSTWCNFFFVDATDNPLYYAHNLYLNNTLVTHLSVPYGVTDIKPHAFYNCTSLLSVSFPDSVTRLGRYSFDGCSNLTSVSLPASIKNYGDYAFQRCANLSRIDITDLRSWFNVNFGNFVQNPLYYAHNLYVNGLLVTDLIVPDDVAVIGMCQFISCYCLTSVTIPASVIAIRPGAFEYCSKLTRVNISDLTKWCHLDFNSASDNPLFYAHNLYLNGSLLTDLVPPNNVSHIGNYSFAGGAGLTSVTIPDGVTSIGTGAFLQCAGLTSVSIPSSVSTIGTNAFRECKELSSLSLSEGITSIGAGAFDYCTGITSVSIPISVSSIGDSAFYGCSGLTSVVVYPTTPPSGGKYMFDKNASSRMIYVPFNSVSDYLTANYWNDYASSITYIQ